MDNIANKIDKLYNQSTYTEKYGGSIFMTVFCRQQLQEFRFHHFQNHFYDMVGPLSA